jgi:isopenicillin N synthase-like dioxygenase
LDSGFFYVVNHGISEEFMDEVFAQSKRFFTLPMKEKMKILRNEKHRGYTPVLDELLDPENQIHGILHVYIDFKISLLFYFFILIIFY